MPLHRYLLAIGLSALWACSSGPHPGAHALLLTADSLTISGHYTEAIRLADSATRLAPADTAILKHAIATKREAHYREAEYMLVQIDRQLRALAPQLKVAQEGFVEQRNQEYNTAPRLVLPSLSAERLGARPHLRALVTSEGLSIISVYTGPQGVEHTSMRLSIASADSTYTAVEMPYDGALNYRYNDGLRQWELVTYPAFVSLQVGNYLDKGLEAGLSPTVELLRSGRPVARFALTPAEARALGQTIRLAKLILEERELKRQQNVYARRFARLDS